MTTAARQWTADDLMALPSGQWRYELVAGALRVHSLGGARHGQVSLTLGARIGLYGRASRLGVVFGSGTGFRLSSDPDTVRAPDVAFVRAERIPPEGVPAGYFPGAPDLAIEVVSPTDRLLDIEDKVTEYLSAGGRVVWVVNPKHQRVTVYPLGAASRGLEGDDQLDGGEVVPGFGCTVREIFE